MLRSLVLLAFVGLAACSTPGTLNYAPSVPIAPAGLRVVSGVAVIDKRDEKPNRIATIRGGYGNPIKVLDTGDPVAAVVQRAFTKALEQRDMVLPAGPFRFQVTLHTLYGDQFMGRKAELLMDLAVLDLAGRTVYADRVTDHSYEFTFFDNGIFASIDTLRADVEKLLNKDIDLLLDKPALRNALRASSTVAVAGPAS